MSNGPASQGMMLDASDSLEAVSVFRLWKNLFFAAVLICLVGIQVGFWLVDLGIVEPDATSEAAVRNQVVGPAGAIEEAARRTLADADGVAGSPEGGDRAGLPSGFDFPLLARVVKFISGILIVAAGMYAFTLFFSLLTSLVSRLGGINQIARAFVLSLIVAVLITPWQHLGLLLVGVVYTPEELLRWLGSKDTGILNLIFYYLRFTGLWLAVMFLLILAQIRTARWSQAILRRLEII